MRNVILLTVGLFVLSSNAVAQMVEADLQTGRRWAETKAEGETDGTQLNEVTFAARFNPFVAGLSVGPSFTFAKYRSADLGEGTKASNYELGLEAKYSHALNDVVSPYAKARYVAYSKGTMDIDTDGLRAEANFRTYGAQFGLGAAFALTSSVALTAEAGYGVQMIRVTGGEIKSATDDDGNAIALADGDETLEGSRREDFNSKSFALGLNVTL